MWFYGRQRQLASYRLVLRRVLLLFFILQPSMHASVSAHFTLCASYVIAVCALVVFSTYII